MGPYTMGGALGGPAQRAGRRVQCGRSAGSCAEGPGHDPLCSGVVCYNVPSPFFIRPYTDLVHACATINMLEVLGALHPEEVGEQHPAAAQGTVLIHSGAELESYSRSEEDRLEALISGIAASGAKVVAAHPHSATRDDVGACGPVCVHAVA